MGETFEIIKKSHVLVKAVLVAQLCALFFEVLSPNSYQNKNCVIRMWSRIIHNPFDISIPHHPTVISDPLENKKLIRMC